MAHMKSDYHNRPKTKAPDDFWGQVERTVNGKPVPEDQIRMIVDAIRGGLALDRQDVVLDIACGNGALSQLLFDGCAGLFGYDFSEYLISVAKQNFARPPAFDFGVGSAAAFARDLPEPDRYTKALCYGSFAYFSEAEAKELLQVLAARYTRVSRIFIGNLPDRDLAHLFYKDGRDWQRDLDDHTAQIGMWRSVGQFEALARATGWSVRIQRMPAEFYAAYYRYDAILERA